MTNNLKSCEEQAGMTINLEVYSVRSGNGLAEHSMVLGVWWMVETQPWMLHMVPVSDTTPILCLWAIVN